MKTIYTAYLPSCLLALLMAGCASQQTADSSAAADGQPPEVAEQPAPVPVSEVVKPAPTRPFSIDTLYSLLVAEFAGNRERYDIALNNYIQEARRTRDPGVAARATRIARYLDIHQAALSTSLLWADIEPDNPEALFTASSELARAGQLQEAFTRSEKLLRMGSTPVFTNIAARAGQATDTQREQLAGEFDRLLAEYPGETELLVGRAMLLQQEDRPEESLAMVREALALNGEDIQAAVLEARLLYQLERPDQALQRLMTLLQQNPDNQRLRLQYARLLASVDMEEAQSQFEILVTQSPDDPDLLYSLALVAAEREDTALAKTTFERLLNMGAYTDAAHFYLGRIAEGEEDSATALMHYDAVRGGPDFLPALDRALDIQIRQGQLDAARDKMDNWRQTLPDQQSRLYLLEAQVLARHQYMDESIALLTEALNQSPTDADLLYTRAMLHEQRDRLDLTEQDLRTIIKYQPNNATALNALGYTLADRTTRYQEAHELIEQALRISPNDPAIMDSMGWVQYRLGNYDEALLRLRQALKLFPDHEVAAHLGEVLWVSGETEEARAVWEEGLRLNPDSDLIREAMDRLMDN